MERLCGVAKRRRLCDCTSDGVCACIFKKPYYDWIPQRFDDLTDDLLAEILLKLPAKILHRCKSVSKRWLSLISSSSFARSFILNCRLSDVPANKMLLFKLQRSLPGMGEVYAIPLLHDLVDDSSLPSSFDFIPPLKPDNYDVNLYYFLNPRKVTDRLLMSIDLIGTYGGLVLLKGEFRDPVDVSSLHQCSPHYYYYYVCNPITKHWVELPVIPTLDHIGFTCYYLQQAQGEGLASRIWADVAFYDNLIKHNANYDPNKIDFTVVSIKPDEHARVFVIHVLSSADEVGRWNIFRIPFPPSWTSVPYGNKVVFANGKFHWCGENCIAAYDPFCNPGQCDLIPFPPMNPLDIDSNEFFTLVAFEGSLRLVKPFTPKRLVAWDLVDYGNKVWVKNIDVSYDNCDQHRLVFKSFVGAAAKHKVYFVAHPATVLLFNVKNKSFQHFYYPSNLDFFTNLYSVEPFISSPWPTPIPLLRSRN